MHSVRRTNGRFIKKSVFQRNKKAKQIKQSKGESDKLSAEHSYSQSQGSSADNDSFIAPDLSNVQHEEVCFASGDEDFLDENVYTGGQWKEGRVVVDLDVLLNSLDCQKCSLPLDPKACLGLHPNGVTGYIYIKCFNVACNNINRIPLGKTHRSAKTGPAIFDVNSKLPSGKCQNIQM